MIFPEVIIWPITMIFQWFFLDPCNRLRLLGRDFILVQLKNQLERQRQEWGRWCYLGVRDVKKKVSLSVHRVKVDVLIITPLNSLSLIPGTLSLNITFNSSVNFRTERKMMSCTRLLAGQSDWKNPTLYYSDLIFLKVGLNWSFIFSNEQNILINSCLHRVVNPGPLAPLTDYYYSDLYHRLNHSCNMPCPLLHSFDSQQNHKPIKVLEQALNQICLIFGKIIFNICLIPSKPLRDYW